MNCPKCTCGVMTGPTFVPAEVAAQRYAGPLACPLPKECLEYRCNRCGFSKQVDAHDAEKIVERRRIIKEERAQPMYRALRMP